MFNTKLINHLEHEISLLRGELRMKEQTISELIDKFVFNKRPVRLAEIVEEASEELLNPPKNQPPMMKKGRDAYSMAIERAKANAPVEE